MSNANSPYDERLKEAMARMKAILLEYDIAANIQLGSPTHIEFLYHFPTWSIAQLVKEGDKVGIRIRSQQDDYPSKEAQREAAEATVHFLLRFRDQAALTFARMEQIEAMLRQHGWEIEHDAFSGFTPHRDQ